jgi:hypothetical protein
MKIYAPNITGSFIGNISGSTTSTGSFGKLLADGSQLTNLPASYTSAQISGSWQGQNFSTTQSFSDGTATLISGSASSTGSFGHIITAGHIIPTVSETYDLGSSAYPFRDLHISSASIKIYDGDGEVARLQISDDYGLEVFKTKDLTVAQKSTYTPAQIRSNATKKNTGALDPETAEYAVVDSDSNSFLSAVYVTDTNGNFIIASQES